MELCRIEAKCKMDERWYGGLHRCALVPSLALVVVIGCSRPDDNLTGPPALSQALPLYRVSVTHPSGGPKTQDEIFADIAAHIPGYAGTYYAKDGTPVTNLVNLENSAAAAQTIAPLVKGGMRGTPPGKSQFRKVAHDFLKLKKWKDHARASLLTRPNVYFLDIDEENNRLSIGVLNATEKAFAVQFLNDNNIPGAVAVVLPPADPPPNPYPESQETLRNTQSLYGGVQIMPGGFAVCSLGFNTILSAENINGSVWTYSYDHFLVTAGHCMNSVGSSTGTPVYQTPTRSRVIGYEYRQPLWQSEYYYSPGQSYYDCPAGSRCSLAEVALVRYTVPWGGSRIARTTFAGSAQDTGSVTLDYSAPWQVADSVMDHTLLTGTLIMKVGRSTGWTQGYITQTCTDYRLHLNGQPTQFVVLCSWSTNFTSRGGDSGAPVFKNKFGSYPQVQIVGTIWAGATGVSTFSFYPYISYELTEVDRRYGCGSVYPCWPRLSVSGQ